MQGRGTPQPHRRLGHDRRRDQVIRDEAAVAIPALTIGPGGSLSSIVHNRWCNGRSGPFKRKGYYSLIAHAKSITIKENPEALGDLLDYARGEYKVGGSWRCCQLERASRSSCSAAPTTPALCASSGSTSRGSACSG